MVATRFGVVTVRRSSRRRPFGPANGLRIIGKRLVGLVACWISLV